MGRKQKQNLSRLNVHFMADPYGNKDNYRLIVEAIEKLIEKPVIDRHILTRTQQDVEAESVEESEEFVRKSQAWMKVADIVVFEVTSQSLSAGHDIALALHALKKHVVLVYQESSEPIINTLKGLKTTRLHMVPYTPKVIEQRLTHTFQEILPAIKRPLPVNIPTELRVYLDWLVETHRAETMTSYLTTLLQKDMEENEEYQKI